jgi:chemotaxis protein methyltransferase CheR
MIVNPGESAGIGILGLRKLNQVTKNLYGFDLRLYAATSLMRKIEAVIQRNHLKDIDSLIQLLESRSSFFPVFQSQLSISCSELLRDPAYWRCFRDDVLPILNKINHKIRIWVAGCSSGEEAVSLAIMLYEAGLYEKSSVLVTGINELAISEARKKTYRDKQLENSENNYKRFSNNENAAISRYLNRKDSGFVFKDELYNNLRYEVFNGSETNEIKGLHVVLCRNYFIYCTPEYQNELLGLFTGSLIPGGFLAIGNKEDISFCDDFSKYLVFNKKEKIFQKRPY